ncbi:MAG: hypothetical protein QME66_06130 [Candidatus Eisenbacteria bacterium]|nr:hypothetical protein [Candidatus Eisenbacteria bacterium]
MTVERNARQKSCGKAPSFERGETAQAKIERVRDRVKSGYYDLPEVKRSLAVLLAEFLEKEQ